ncbi:hypothetical protein L596_020791 [Steinernema carpocapsae]|uniref:Uncharacterized protein n=1 Tax=Steinernema carpocapsae TaxID=34508 RepID=A0A4U5MUK4_STECR|nr:hypothetical protein L596_020791 [Steinernema carpocapsae]
MCPQLVANGNLLSTTTYEFSLKVIDNDTKELALFYCSDKFTIEWHVTVWNVFAATAKAFSDMVGGDAQEREDNLFFEKSVATNENSAPLGDIAIALVSIFSRATFLHLPPKAQPLLADLFGIAGQNGQCGVKLNPKLCACQEIITPMRVTNPNLEDICSGKSVLAASQYGVAIVLSFHFRYVAICHSQRMKTVHPAWGYFYCIGLHLVFAVFILYTLQQWEISLEDYPNPEEIAGKDGLFVTVPTKQQEFNDPAYLECVVFAILGNTDHPVIPAPKTSGKSCPSAHCGYAKKGFVESCKVTAVPLLMAGVPALGVLFALLYTLERVNECSLYLYY